MSDTYCDLEGWGPETLGQFFETPARPPLAFFSVSDEIPPWTVNHVWKCGKNVGRFQSMIAEKGVPYQKPFGKMAVGPSWMHSHYMNEREDMALAAVTADDDIVMHPAGVIGWSHPNMQKKWSISALYARTDRADVALESDKPKIRANLHNYEWADPDTGLTRNFIIATGWVLPSVTRAEVIEIDNASISGVSSVVSTVNGIGVEMITADLVRNGRATSAQLTTPTLEAAAVDMEWLELDAAELELILPKETPMSIDDMTSIDQIDMASATVREELADLVGEVIDQKLAPVQERLEAADIPQLPEPVPEPTVDDELAVLKADLSRRAAEATAPDFAAIGDSNLSRIINSAYNGAEEGRYAFYERVGTAAGLHRSTIRQWSNNQISCPPLAALTAAAAELPGVSVDQLVAAARRDKCTRYPVT